MALVTGNPWMKTVALATANTKYSLLTLMRALDPLAPDHCQAVQIQFWRNAGNAVLYLGNSDVDDATSGAGVELVATQAFGFQSVEANRIDLGQIWLMSDTNTQKVRVTALRM